MVREIMYHWYYICDNIHSSIYKLNEFLVCFHYVLLMISDYIILTQSSLVMGDKAKHNRFVDKYGMKDEYNVFGMSYIMHTRYI